MTDNKISVSEAVSKRSSIRAFKDSPVDSNIIREILSLSSRAPSGGNVQPWKIYVLNGQSMQDFFLFQKSWIQPEKEAYSIFGL